MPVLALLLVHDFLLSKRGIALAASHGLRASIERHKARLNAELTAARGQIKHLILLLGVPIAYPRLALLENLFTSPIIAPIRLLNKRFGLAGGLFNQFDGQIDLLDDLDDHYTAKHHKTERRELIVRLQELSQQHSVRVTILGGDVHLAAIGRFYSNSHHDVAAEKDNKSKDEKEDEAGGDVLLNLHTFGHAPNPDAERKIASRF